MDHWSITGPVAYRVPFSARFRARLTSLHDTKRRNPLHRRRRNRLICAWLHPNGPDDIQCMIKQGERMEQYLHLSHSGSCHEKPFLSFLPSQSARCLRMVNRSCEGPLSGYRIAKFAHITICVLDGCGCIENTSHNCAWYWFGVIWRPRSPVKVNLRSHVGDRSAAVATGQSPTWLVRAHRARSLSRVR